MVKKSVSLSLVLDNRERATFEHFPDDDETIVTAQMTVGDYVIVESDTKGSGGDDDASGLDRIRRGYIHEIFERKTLKDYADSIRDGRHENRLKMLSLRDRTACRVYYIIEGPPLSSLSSADKIGGIPASTIEASIFNLMSNSNIFVLYSSSQADTARLLMAKRKALAASISSKKLERPNLSDDVHALLTAPPVVTYNQLKKEYFEKFKSIGPKMAEELARKVTVSSWILGDKCGDTIPKTILINSRKMKVAHPPEMSVRLAALSVIPRAGTLRGLIDRAEEVEDYDTLTTIIDEECKGKLAAKIKTLLDHEYDEDDEDEK